LLVDGDPLSRERVEAAVPKGWSALELDVDRGGAVVVPLEG
jgi:hypothetical protein